MTRIVDRHVHLLVANDVEVVLAEIGGDDARHERLDFSDRLAFEPRIDRHRARRHAGPAPDHEHRSRLRRDERREMAEHALQPHVLRLARRLHLSGVVIVQHAIRQARHRDRRVPSFADVDVLGLAHARRRVAPVRDEHARHRMHRAREERRAAGGDHERHEREPRFVPVRAGVDRLQRQQRRHR